MKKITKVLIYLTTGVGVMKLRTKDHRIKNLYTEMVGLDWEEALKKNKWFLYAVGALMWPAIIVDNLFEFIADDIFDLDVWNL